MKHSVLVLAGALLVGGATAFAQQAEVSHAIYVPGPYTGLKIHKVLMNFEANLRSPINGVVESTIGHIIWLRLVRPDANLDRLQDELSSVAVSGATASIRYRASLASMVLYSPTLFSNLLNRSYASPNDLFATVSGRAQETLIGQNH